MRDVLPRYRGGGFGVLWIFVSPPLMLGIASRVSPSRPPRGQTAPPFTPQADRR